MNVPQAPSPAPVEQALARAHEVIEVLRGYKLAQGTEKDLQAAIAKVLFDEGFSFEREARLSAEDRPDFLVLPGVAIEVKIKGPIAAILRQLARYAMHQAVRVVLFVTTCRDHVAPEVLEGKPVLTVYVGSAFL